jgi:TPP-dependent trihydroxycyclohexane-1,2-dione (THcHDO) dehydratase
VLAKSAVEFETAMSEARSAKKTFLIAAQVSASANVPAYDTRWNVAISEIAVSQKVRSARQQYESSFFKENL